MHIYHTNFDMRDAPRRELDRRLLETLLEVREYFRARAVIENEFLDPDFYHGFFDANLAKIIIDTAINFLDKEDYDARLLGSNYVALTIVIGVKTEEGTTR